MSIKSRSVISPKHVKIKSRHQGRRRACRFVTALAIAGITLSFFSARAHLAWAGKETAGTIAAKKHGSEIPTTKNIAKDLTVEPASAPGGKLTSANLTASLNRSVAYIAKSAKSSDKKLVNPQTKR